ncbi:hypothetical protein BC831DRAFT_447218 [Entophlyctis helioformis]|nr:hypothetical protein BC831DRAFT_447218 [Entophlyctis helioformis]
MSTKFIAPNTAPLHIRLLTRGRPPLASVAAHVEAFQHDKVLAPGADGRSPAHASRTNADTGHPTTAALLPSTAFQLSQLLAAIQWELAARPSRAAVIQPAKRPNSELAHSSAASGAASASASLSASASASASAGKAAKKTKPKKTGSKWA